MPLHCMNVLTATFLSFPVVHHITNIPCYKHLSLILFVKAKSVMGAMAKSRLLNGWRAALHLSFSMLRGWIRTDECPQRPHISQS